MYYGQKKNFSMEFVEYGSTFFMEKMILMLQFQLNDRQYWWLIRKHSSIFNAHIIEYEMQLSISHIYSHIYHHILNVIFINRLLNPLLGCLPHQRRPAFVRSWLTCGLSIQIQIQIITLTSQWASWRLKSPGHSTISFKLKPKKTSKSALPALCEGNPPVGGGFPSQRAGNAESVFMTWHHNVVRHMIYALFCCVLLSGINRLSGPIRWGNDEYEWINHMIH